MKKIAGLLLAAVLAAGLCLGAYAADGEAAGSRAANPEERQLRIETLQAANGERLAKLQEFNAFRESLLEHRQVILENREKNLSLTAANEQVRQGISETLGALQEAGVQLPEDVKAQLSACNEQVRSLASRLRETKGAIRTVTEGNRENIRIMDYEAMDAAFVQIAEIQETRYALLTQIRSVLQEMQILLQGLSGSVVAV
jgi:hypothetical protein